MMATGGTEQKDPTAMLQAAGLAPDVVRGWLSRRPEFEAGSDQRNGLRDAGERLNAFSRATDELLNALPPRPERDDQANAAAQVLSIALREARAEFMRLHADEVYRSLTGDYGKFLRIGALLSKAADQFPGLLPSNEALQAERQRTLREKEGLEVDQCLFLCQILFHPVSGLHLIHASMRPTEQAEELRGRFRADGVLDLGPVRLERHGRAGHLLLNNRQYLNAEDDSTILPMEIAIDLVLLDDGIDTGVLRGSVVEHPKYAGRHVFNAGINLTHLYHGRISLTGFFLERELGMINKIYRGLSGPRFLPRELESGIEKPWLAAVESFAIGGGCQLLLVMDRVLAERSAFFTLPARKEGFIPGAANLRLPRFVGDRLTRQAILGERAIASDSPEGRLICDEVVEPGEMGEAIERGVEALCGAGLAGVVANRKALRLALEPIDTFRQYMAVYAREQAFCQMSPALVDNLERNWNAKERQLKD
jgi:(3,5-dihydroxyphenyl)acetyl-CoA 1,2-dioxygenase